jgi:hypothetical protein
MGGKIVNHWDRHAQQWELVGPPLRPSTQDTDYFKKIIRDWSSDNGQENPSALLLGVTPELAQLDWPDKTRLFAADYSTQMIRSLWPLQNRQDRLAFCADWRKLPLPHNSAGIVIGDGCFTLLSYPAGYQDLARETRRALRDNGLLIVRFFIGTGDTASPEQIHEQLLAGKIGNFHIFKFRLAIALQDNATEGVCVGDVWENWNAQGYDVDRLAAKLNWQPETLRTIDAYRGMSARYTYPTMNELESALSPWFYRVKSHNHGYEFGENCPTLVLQPCGD